MKKCRNKCIFCFIDQLPGNLRKTLYFKDDDYLESFKYGNFVTLTNLNKKDIENILKYRISPLYVSFHSADNDIREILFGNKNTCKAVEILKIFDINKINVHIQIVLCPGINDGNDLLNNLDFLNNNFQNILSIGIVPVGITDYNKNSMLLGYDKRRSIDLIKIIENYNEKNNHKKNIFLSDEFYIIAGYDFPSNKSYGRFYQIENGIGLCRNFIHESDCFLKKITANLISGALPGNKIFNNILIKDHSEKIIENLSENILILTSEYFYKTMTAQVEKIRKYIKKKTLNLNLNLKVNHIKNYFLGGNVKVSGLLTYHDFICWHNCQSSVDKKEFCRYGKIIIPNIIFNKDGLTLDNKTKGDFLNIYKNIKFINPDGESFLKEIFEL
jgi:putative radical SAM enzyme (TIGR03279 family)